MLDEMRPVLFVLRHEKTGEKRELLSEWNEFETEWNSPELDIGIIT